MTLIHEALWNIQQRLASLGIPDSRLESELLIMYSLGKSRASLYSSLKDTITYQEDTLLHNTLRRREHREPIFYIIGHREFFGIRIDVTRGVFIPRQDTELLVEEALAIARALDKNTSVLADIGTGTGAIAIAIALNLKDCHMFATDTSPAAIKAAMANVQSHGLDSKVTIREGDLMDPITERVDIVIANLPYIQEADMASLAPEVRLYEPEEALNGGSDGLSVIRKLLKQLTGKLDVGAYCLLEIDPRQWDQIKTDLRSYFPAAKITPLLDLTNQVRVVSMQNTIS